MNPQDGKSNSSQPPAADATPAVGNPLNTTVGSDVGASNPLGGSGNPVADAANQAAAAQTVPTPAQTPAETDFLNKFGGEVPPVEPTSATPPPTEPAPDLTSVLGALDTAPTQAPASVSDVNAPTETPAPGVPAESKPE